jgi:hypothetical protein
MRASIASSSHSNADTRRQMLICASLKPSGPPRSLTCSNLLSTKLSKSILVRALNRRGLADSMMALVMVIPMGEGIG